jgi:hypothetical protein
MTSPERGKWRVEVQNTSVMEMDNQAQPTVPVTTYDSFDSLEAALKFACDKRLILHHKVTIQTPDGAVMNEEELAQHCAELRR